MPTPITTVLALLVLLAPEPLALQQVHHVVAGGAGAGDGTSWTDAFGDLQQALLAASAGDQIWIAEGRYTPAPPGGAPTASFVLAPGVSLSGGFAGTETSPAQRVPGHPTVLSGDLLGDDASPPPNKADNVHRVLTAGPGIGPDTVLDGLVVAGGYATDSFGGHASGAALGCEGGGPTVVGCTFEDCLATLGGAVIVTHGAAPTFTDCTFASNRAWSGRAGALYVASGTEVTVERCTFVGNSSQGFSSVGDGGALFVEGGAACTVRDSTFVGNRADAYEPNFATGGAISNLSNELTLVRCVFRDNVGRVGGALWNAGDVTIAGCLFAGNTADVGGGAMNFACTVQYVACTIVANAAPDGGGLANGWSAAALVADSIVWGNLSPGQPTARAQVHDLSGGNSSFVSSCVQGLLETIPGEDPPDPHDFPGCHDDDPLFVDAPADLHLLSGSPCIDAGDNAWLPPGLLTDLDGAPRLLDDPATPDTGEGGPPVVDMGAYEAGGSPWKALGGGSAGLAGIPDLLPSGSLAAGSPVGLELVHAAPSSLVLLMTSVASTPLAVLGGTLHTAPIGTVLLLGTDAAGTFAVSTTWPPGVPAGIAFWLQCLCADAASPAGLTLSNAVKGTTP